MTELTKALDEPHDQDLLAWEYGIEGASDDFRVHDEATAAWAFRKLQEAQAEIDRVDAEATAMCKEIDERAQAITKPIEGTVAFFSTLLTAYHREILEADPRRKTVKLLCGAVLRARRRRGALRVDREEFVRWAQEAGRDDLLRFKAPEPDVVALRRALAVSENGTACIEGEPVPGVDIEEDRVHFTVGVASAADPEEDEQP